MIYSDLFWFILIYSNDFNVAGTFLLNVPSVPSVDLHFGPDLQSAQGSAWHHSFPPFDLETLAAAWEHFVSEMAEMANGMPGRITIDDG